MTSVADFIKLPKADYHSTLNFGMRYPSYVAWAGFYVPDFPADGSQVTEELTNQIREYTFLRTGCSQDIQKLVSLSLAESIGDNIAKINGALSIELLSKYDTPATITELLKATSEKYSAQIELNTYLSVDSDHFTPAAFSFAEELLKSDFFKGIYIFGKNLFTSPEDFIPLVKIAEAKNLKIKINAKKAESCTALAKLFRTFVPSSVVQPDFSEDKKTAALFRQQNIQAILTPKSRETGRTARLLRDFLEAGADAKLGTQSILLCNKSISQFASELCNTGIFTKEEMTALIQESSSLR